MSSTNAEINFVFLSKSIVESTSIAQILCIAQWGRISQNSALCGNYGSWVLWTLMLKVIVWQCIHQYIRPYQLDRSSELWGAHPVCQECFAWVGSQNHSSSCICMSTLFVWTWWRAFLCRVHASHESIVWASIGGGVGGSQGPSGGRAWETIDRHAIPSV
jgi:hypothetical protein